MCGREGSGFWGLALDPMLRKMHLRSCGTCSLRRRVATEMLSAFWGSFCDTENNCIFSREDPGGNGLLGAENEAWFLRDVLWKGE